MKYIKTIVVADDESMQCEILSQIISQMIPEAQIFSCSNGVEAYEIIRERSVDVLITDIRMPEMDGMMLIEKVSKEFPGVKTLLISAYQEFEYARNAIKFGVFDYLVKPFRIEHSAAFDTPGHEEIELALMKLYRFTRENAINFWQSILSIPEEPVLVIRPVILQITNICSPMLR